MGRRLSTALHKFALVCAGPRRREQAALGTNGLKSASSSLSERRSLAPCGRAKRLKNRQKTGTRPYATGFSDRLLAPALQAGADV
jgi:hypothetical protein